MTCPICNAPLALWELHPDGSRSEFMWQCGGSREHPCNRPGDTLQEMLTTGIQTYLVDMVGMIAVITMNVVPVGRYCLPHFENRVGGVFQ